MRDSKCG